MRHRTLVAARPEVWPAIQSMLADADGMQLIPAHTGADAFRALEREKIDLIICTVGFEESQMMDFLQAVKASAFASIPFLCSRVLPGFMRDAFVSAMSDACKACGADFVDVARLPADSAKSEMLAAVATCLDKTSVQSNAQKISFSAS